MSIQRTRPRLLTVQQVARHFGVAARTVWRWEALGAIPRGLRLSRTTVRWRKVEIDRHLRSLTKAMNEGTQPQ